MPKFVRPMLLPIIATATLTSVRADCLMPWLNVPGGYCDGCRYEGTISLNHNETCERVSETPQGKNDVQFLGSRIVQKAKHGIAGANGATIAYQPAKDFVGSDEFIMEMNFRQNNVLGKYTAHYVVTVK